MRRNLKLLASAAIAAIPVGIPSGTGGMEETDTGQSHAFREALQCQARNLRSLTLAEKWCLEDKIAIRFINDLKQEHLSYGEAIQIIEGISIYITQEKERTQEYYPSWVDLLLVPSADSESKIVSTITCQEAIESLCNKMKLGCLRENDTIKDFSARFLITSAANYLTQYLHKKMELYSRMFGQAHPLLECVS